MSSAPVDRPSGTVPVSASSSVPSGDPNNLSPPAPDSLSNAPPAIPAGTPPSVDGAGPAHTLLAEQERLWTCAGCPRKGTNAGRMHYQVPMTIDGRAAMGCVYCKADLTFLPAVNMPRRRSYY